ncbi:yqey-like family protein [Lyngbya aestuarii BL J]|uniref:Yqey-like family protein n=1 Tax=Lyngbya aestuarii BL J TaxID=1348334 RepID=U7QLD3_9CYAN|nr:GatB/YqeY domain-containing protein [Lyngbya aestuarii]ERT08774.1 yqey-like family protein [Lyngbya aestuarii BL J]
MSLKDQISEEIKAAMKAKDKVRLEAVRSIKKVLIEKESEVKGKGQETLTPEQELEVLMQQAKQRRDSINQYQQAGREDLAEAEKAELVIIEEFLPQQLSDAEVAAIIDEVIAEVNASSPKDMGKVMGPVMQRLKGQADGKKVQELVTRSLDLKSRACE